MFVTTKTHRKVESDVAMKGHGRRDLVNLEYHPRSPIANQDVGIDQRRLDILRQGIALCLGQVGHDMRNHHVEAGEHDMLSRDPVGCASPYIAEQNLVTGVADIDASRVQANANVMIASIQTSVVERS